MGVAKGDRSMMAGRQEVPPDRVAAYIRWSTDEQGHGTTLDVQQERVALFIQSQGWMYREELLFIDDGFSGATLERPGLSRLREAIQTGLVDCVVVYKLDRLSRSLVDTVNLVSREWAGRAVLCSATESFDTRSPVGQMLFNILASFAEFERSLIRERTLSGKRKRAEQGRNAGQRYPMGYRKGPDGSWALDGWDAGRGEFTGPAATVRRIFDAFLAGLGTGSVARMLNAESMLTPTGKAWRFHYVARILRNPIYAGVYRYGKGPNGETEGCTESQGSVPPIISAGEFARAQRLLDGRRTARREPVAYLLTGLARCGRCGSPIAGSRGRTKRYYICTGRRLLGCCDCASLDADRVEEAVLSELRRRLASLPPAHEAIRARWAHLVSERRRAMRLAESERLELERRRRRADDEFLAGVLTGEIYSRLSARLLAEAEVMRERLEEAERALAVARLGEEEIPPGERLVDAWAELTTEEVREVIRLLSESLTLYQAPGRPGSRHGNPAPVSLTWKIKNRPHCTGAQWGGFTTYSNRS